MPFTDLNFRPAYDPDVCPDPVAEFYAPALAASVAYDRNTFTFNAQGLVAAAAGLVGLLRNDGRMRIICEPRELSEEIRQAIIDGHEQALLDAVPPADLTRLTEGDVRAKTQLEIITWLVAQGRLEIRVAIPRTAEPGVFHAKTGIMTDTGGDCISFDGSPNETEAGWGRNYERFHLFRSWAEPERVQADAEHFQRLWKDQSSAVRVIPLPQAYAEQLIAVAPKEAPAGDPAAPGVREAPADYNPQRNSQRDARRDAYWQAIREAIRNDPATTVATTPTALWPHQADFFRRHAAGPGPDRLLIADEVGLGKTIQAGILLKARINQGQVKRLLILAPRPACRQWQEELRHKLCLSVPVLETGGRTRLSHPDGTETEAPNPPWALDPSVAPGSPLGSLSGSLPDPSLAPGSLPGSLPDPSRAPGSWPGSLPGSLIVSYQWLRQHSAAFLESDPQYDLVIVDEAHRARFSEVATANRQPNQFLTLLRQLATRTWSLLLLTATPMQLHEAELHALLELLEPTGWEVDAFRRFYDPAEPGTLEDWRFMTERYRPHSPDRAARDERLIHDNNRAYVANHLTPERMDETARLMRERSPAKRRMSRHTRETLRRYAREGRIQATIPERRVHPVAVLMNDAERGLYDDIDALVNEVYASAPGLNPTALGFIMTTYRRRLGSSPRAFAQTCRNHLQRRSTNAANAGNAAAWREIARLDDADLEDLAGEPLPAAAIAPGAVARLEQAARDADRLERRDTKLGELQRRLTQLAAAGHRKVIIFTQFRDTMLYLADRLAQAGHSHITCLSGQDHRTPGARTPGSETPGSETPGDRGQRIQALREADAGLLICTETASESLNLQFCTAMVNYDIPWNPMTLEQRIGRIDRIGQERPAVDIVNLFYADTAEWDAYEAMRERLLNIHGHVGQYQPILYDPAAANHLAGIIRSNLGRAATRAAVNNIASGSRLNLDTLNSTLAEPSTIAAQVTMSWLQRALEDPSLLPEGWNAEHAGGLHWYVSRPGGKRYTVTTELASYDYAPGSVEWFGPGSPAFPS